MAANRLRRVELFVAKLPWTVCQDTLKEYFQKFGPVTGSRVVFDFHSGRSKKFGFVEFESPESAEKVLAEPNHFIDGAKIYVQSKTQERDMKRRPQEQFSNQTDQTDTDRDFSAV